MDNEIITVESSCDNEHSNVHLEEETHSDSNQHDTNPNDDGNNEQDLTMDSTDDLSSKSFSIKGLIIFAIFTILAMLTGVLIVCFRSPKPPGKTCTFILKSEALSSITDDSHPRSVAVGDFNNDGFLDMVVPNSGTNNIGVFIRDGTRTFTDQIIYSTGLGTSPYAVAVGHLNHDQYLDIAVANFGTNNIGIFFGIGNGSFIPYANFSTGSSRPRWIVVCDFNNDTYNDIAIVNYGTNNIGVLLQDNNGSFGEQTTFSTGFDSIPYSLVVGDVNNDGKLDIVAANYGTNNVGILLAHGNGTFASQITIDMGINSRPNAIAINDLNNDTYMDIAVVCSGTNSIGILLGLGNETFTIPTIYSTGVNSLPQSVAIGDFDNDGTLDIAVSNYDTSSINVFFGYGTGVFANQMTFYTDDDSKPYLITTGDFNNDTRLDIAAVNYDQNYVDIILTYRNYTFSSQDTYKTTGLGTYPMSIIAADFNNDNRLDIIVANYWTGDIGVFLGYENDTFSSQTTYSTGSGSGPYYIANGDFNNDNQSDIVVANYWTNNIGVLLSNGDGTFSDQTTFSTGSKSEPSFVAVGDFNNDTRLDIVVVNYGKNNIGIFLGYGNASFSTQKTYSTGSNSQPYALTIGDVNNDKRLDIIVANYGTNNIGVFLGYGNGTFLAQKTYSTGSGSGPSFLVCRDVTGDDLLDIVVANSNTNKFAVLVGYGNGSFLLRNTYSVGSGYYTWTLAIDDINNDKQLDIIVTNYPNNLAVFLGYGNGNFSLPEIYETGSNSQPYSVVISDLNNDGKPDIAIANYATSNVGVFVGYGNGSFTDQKTYSTREAAYPQYVTVGDFNNDNQLDIVVVNNYGDNIDIFFGYRNGSFGNQTSYSTGDNSDPMFVAVADFNNDKNLDIVVANSGTNNIIIFLNYGNGSFPNQITYSTGSDSEPYSVAVGDFNNDTRLDIVAANFGTNNIVVFLGYGNGSFYTQQTYSTGDGSGPQFLAIQDFDKDGLLDIAVACQYTSSLNIFFGYGNGSFLNQSIFSLGIGTDPNSIAIGDLNNDDNLDLVVTTFYGRSIAIFLGYSNGTLINLVTYSAGSGSRPQSCLIADWNYDNQMDIIVSNCGTNNIVVFFGTGDGTFSDQESYSTGENSCPISIAFGHFNNDTLMDVTVANSYTNTIGIFLGTSYMSGEREAAYSTGSSPHPRAIALGSFADKRQLDITMVNYGLDNVGVLLGYMNGTFPSQTMFSTGTLSLPTSVAVSDLDNDGELDIIVANSAADNVGILYGYGNGSFTNLSTYSTGLGSSPQSIVIGDFNNDKKSDIAVVNSGTNNVLTMLKYDIGAFHKQIPYSTDIDSLPQWVFTGDFNNDDRLDFTVVNSNNDNIGVFIGLGGGNFANQTTYSTGSGSFPLWAAAIDVNNDSCLDIIVCNLWTDNFGLFLGFGNGTFTNQTSFSTGYDSGPGMCAFGDFNNDSRLDIVVTLEFTCGISIFRGYGNGTFSSFKNYSTGTYSYPSAIAVGDFNNDNILDIVVTNYGYGNIYIFQGSGDGTFFNVNIYSTGSLSNSKMVIVIDLNGDNRLDIVVANSGTDNIGVFFGNDNGTFANQTSFSTGNGSAPYALAIVDLNNDNQSDIAVANFGNDNLGILLGCVNGTFFNQLTYSTGDYSQPYSLAIGDFNNDNRLDIITANSAIDNVGLFLGYVTEDFLISPAYSIEPSSLPTSIAVGDFNYDTRLDIVIANNGTNNIMILYGSGYGTFVSQTNYSTGNDSQPCWVAVSDLNNDNLLDLVVANSGADNVGIFLANGSGTFLNQMTYFTGLRSQPYSVVIVDFDNDTHLDIAVASYGSNSIGVFFGYSNGSFGDQLIFYTGYQSHPYALAVGDVNNDNLTDIIATNNGYGKALTRASPHWPGIFNMLGKCMKNECCCPTDFTLTQQGSNHLRIQVQFDNHCKEPLDAVLPLPSGFNIVLPVSKDKLNCTLSDDSNMLTVDNIDRPPCSDIAARRGAAL
ncbi:unnamed protein product [Adineta steineri]|uniref:Uncharacterized protein n=1 Tax=Adineta steineri TaxID=433720 RepID=A0A814PIA5_9BILA|nr:unnamed protein product [Adineta steineri]CAF1104573.1 unnamed protein product [Adineta steineri]